MWDILADVLIRNGFTGIACLVLGYVCWRLFEELKATQARLQAALEARTTDAQATITKIVELTRSIDKNSDAMHDAIEALRDRR